MDTLLKKHIKKHMHKILDLFSGLGGFSLGLERTGCFKTIAFCDNDKFSKLILDKHWKGVKVYNDVREITKERFIADGIQFPDIITGGFPCQPFSVAGKQKGTSDDRHLWPEMFRIIKAFKPRYVIGENVRGIINIQDGVVFETVCTDLESEEYEVQPFIIPAAGIGAPHRRERVWIIATLVNTEHNGSSTSEIRKEFQKNNKIRTQEEQKSSREFKRTSRSNSERMGNRSTIGSEQYSKRTMGGEIQRIQKPTSVSNKENVENSRRTLRQGSELRETNEDEVGEGYANQSQRSGSSSESNVADTYARLGNGENEEIQSRGQTSNTSSARGRTDVADTESIRTGKFRHPDQTQGREGSRSTQFDSGSSTQRKQSWWLVEPNVGRVAHGVSGRVHRLKGLGNSIVPQIAEEIGRAIIKAEKKGGHYE